MRELYTEHSYIEKEIWCGNGDRKVYGRLFLPSESAEDKKVPLVIFCHELYKTHASLDPYAGQLAGRGIAAVTFDCRGAAEESKSPGSMQNMSVMTCKDDILTVLNEVCTWEFADPGRIACVGASQGAFAAAVAASERPDAFACIVLMYGAYVILDDVENMFAEKESVPDSFSYHGWSMMGARYLTDLWDFDVKTLGVYTKPVLLLHGDSDPLVAASYSERVAKLYEDAEYHLIEGGRHGFKKSAFLEALDLIIRFLDRHGF